jgi:hypothetical protein
MKNSLFIGLSAIILITSCNKNNSSASSTTEIWPLKLNNEWTFSYTVYKEDGSIKETEKYTGGVTGDTMINGSKFYKTGTLFLRNADNNTVEAMGISNFVLPYLKRSEINDNKYYSITTTIYITNGSCIASTYYKSYTGTTDINGHNCLRNEEIYEDCSGGIRAKIVKYFKPGVGLVLTEKYSKKTGNNDLYLLSREILESYKLN